MPDTLLPRDAREIRSILLVKPGSLGDVVHALPCAVALKAAFPAARLTWVIDPRWEGVLDGAGVADGRLAFERDRFRGAAGLARGAVWLFGLRDRRPDLAVDLQCLLRSALIARATRARRTVGLSDAREGARFFYDDCALVGRDQHAVDRYLQVLPLLGAPVPAHPEFPLGGGEAADGLAPGEPFVLIHPFARGEGKAIAPDLSLRIAAALAPAPVVFAGIGEIPGPLPPNASSLAGSTTLPQLIWLIRRAAAVVSADSGPMHIAAAAGVPLLSVHTRTDPRKVGPYASDASVWWRGQIVPVAGLAEAGAPEAGAHAFDAAAADEVAAWAIGQLRDRGPR